MTALTLSAMRDAIRRKLAGPLDDPSSERWRGLHDALRDAPRPARSPQAIEDAMVAGAWWAVCELVDKTEGR